MGAELQPCPFCGSTNLKAEHIGPFYLHCEDCGCIGPNGHTSIGALIRWNERYSPQKELFSLKEGQWVTVEEFKHPMCISELKYLPDQEEWEARMTNGWIAKGSTITGLAKNSER